MRAIYGRKLRSPAPYVARFDGHRRSAAAIIYDCKQVLWQVRTRAPRKRPRGEKMTMCCAHRLTPAGVQDELERDAGDLWRCVGRGRTARGRRRHDQDSGAKAHAAGAMSSAQCPSVTMHAFLLAFAHHRTACGNACTACATSGLYLVSAAFARRTGKGLACNAWLPARPGIEGAIP
jgi:hypothetical protein